MRNLIKARERIHLRELERRVSGTRKKLGTVPISNNQIERKKKKNHRYWVEYSEGFVLE